MEITIFHGKINYKWWFSIVMFVYQRVVDVEPKTAIKNCYKRNGNGKLHASCEVISYWKREAFVAPSKLWGPTRGPGAQGHPRNQQGINWWLLPRRCMANWMGRIKPWSSDGQGGSHHCFPAVLLWKKLLNIVQLYFETNDSVAFFTVDQTLVEVNEGFGTFDGCSLPCEARRTFEIPQPSGFTSEFSMFVQFSPWMIPLILNFNIYWR